MMHQLGQQVNSFCMFLLYMIFFKPNNVKKVRSFYSETTDRRRSFLISILVHQYSIQHWFLQDSRDSLLRLLYSGFLHQKIEGPVQHLRA